jgi:hypothetical protein
MTYKWILLTAGLGDSNMQEAALRVAKCAAKFGKFSQVITLNSSNISRLCPTVNSKYSNLLNSKTRGFGFMSWKAELVYRTLLENIESYGVVWVDAGCELSPSAFSVLKLSRNLNKANRDGFLFFNLNTPESEYTKREVFYEFPKLIYPDSSPQAQTTYFALAGVNGLQIARKWFEVVSKDAGFIDEEIRVQPLPFFKEHRHDQSIFSLTLKENGYHANMKPLRNGRGHLISRYLTFLFDPIVAARNRTGNSIIPICIQRLNGLSLRLLKYFSLIK